MFRPGDEYEIETMVCPFDGAHLMPKSSFVRHIERCKSINKSLFKQCPFDVYHIIRKEHFDTHLISTLHFINQTVNLKKCTTTITKKVSGKMPLISTTISINMIKQSPIGKIKISSQTAYFNKKTLTSTPIMTNPNYLKRSKTLTSSNNLKTKVTNTGLILIQILTRNSHSFQIAQKIRLTHK